MIATLALSALLDAIGDTVRVDTVAMQTTQAMVRARSLLAMALADEAPVPGEQAGDAPGSGRGSGGVANRDTAFACGRAVVRSLQARRIALERVMYFS